MFCKSCGTEIKNESVQFCPQCGSQTGTSGSNETMMQQTASFQETPYSPPTYSPVMSDMFPGKEKYAVLRFAVKLCKIVAVIILVGGVFSSITSCSTASQFGGGYGGVLGVASGGMILLTSCLSALSLWTFAELILVFLDIEANTRGAAK